jgi:hypothetical protein
MGLLDPGYSLTYFVKLDNLLPGKQQQACGSRRNCHVLYSTYILLPTPSLVFMIFTDPLTYRE